MIGLTIVVGVIREIFWGLPTYDPEHIVGAVPVHSGNGLVMGATVLVLLRAFANGGSSLTGVEAISNTVNVFRKPQGRNARRVLTAMACILGFLLAGVAYLAHATHAAPFVAEYPSVLSQVAPGGLRQRADRQRPVLPRPGGERCNLVHRCEYQFQRFSRAGQLRRRRPLSAAAADETRSPSGVLQRHHHAHRAVAGIAGGDRRLGQCADPGVCDRRVHRILDGRLRDDQTPSDSS